MINNAQNPPNFEVTEERGSGCHLIGSTVAGLYYLSSEAKKSNIEDLSTILDQAIISTIDLGCNMYKDKLKEVFEAEIYSIVYESCAFIDQYCAITDPLVRKKLADIVKSLGKEKAG